ncbi:MAG: hypothetical protein RIT45_3998, partial [Pseudomonadota bacterium]
MRSSPPLAVRRFGAFLAIVVAAAVAVSASAAVPQATLFEGVLTSAGGGPVSDGPYALTFSLYEAQSGGSAVWVEGPVEVTVTGGRFAYRIGTTKPLTAAVFAAL